jgi:hypothetical protein
MLLILGKHSRDNARDAERVQAYERPAPRQNLSLCFVSLAWQFTTADFNQESVKLA